MSVRCKMTLESVLPQQWGGSQATFRCTYDPQICAEDAGFQKATPSGFAHFVIDNPAALAQLTIGKAYYFDMTPADDAIQSYEKPKEFLTVLVAAGLLIFRQNVYGAQEAFKAAEEFLAEAERRVGKLNP